MEPESYKFAASDYPKRPAFHVLLTDRLILNLCRNDLDEITEAYRTGCGYTDKQAPCGCGRYWDAKTEGYTVPLNSLKLVHDQTNDTYAIWHDNRKISRDAQFARWLIPHLQQHGFTEKPAAKALFTMNHLWYLLAGVILIVVLYKYMIWIQANPRLLYLACIAVAAVLGTLFYFAARPTKNKRIVYQKSPAD